MHIKSRIQLHIGAALLGNITEHLLGVSFNLIDNQINIDSYYSNTIDEEEKELISEMETEIIASFFPEYNIKWNYEITNTEKLKIKIAELEWVFLKKL